MVCVEPNSRTRIHRIKILLQQVLNILLFVFPTQIYIRSKFILKKVFVKLKSKDRMDLQPNGFEGYSVQFLATCALQILRNVLTIILTFIYFI